MGEKKGRTERHLCQEWECGQLSIEPARLCPAREGLPRAVHWTLGIKASVLMSLADHHPPGQHSCPGQGGGDRCLSGEVPLGYKSEEAQICPWKNKVSGTSVRDPPIPGAMCPPLVPLTPSLPPSPADPMLTVALAPPSAIRALT